MTDIMNSVFQFSNDLLDIEVADVSNNMSIKVKLEMIENINNEIIELLDRITVLTTMKCEYQNEISSICNKRN